MGFLLYLCIPLLTLPVNSCLGRHWSDSKEAFLWYSSAGSGTQKDARFLTSSPHFAPEVGVTLAASSGQKLWCPAEAAGEEGMSRAWAGTRWERLSCKCLVSPIPSSKRRLEYKKRKKGLACWTFVSTEGVPHK